MPCKSAEDRKSQQKRWRENNRGRSREIKAKSAEKQRASVNDSHKRGSAKHRRPRPRKGCDTMSRACFTIRTA